MSRKLLKNFEITALGIIPNFIKYTFMQVIKCYKNNNPTFYKAVPIIMLFKYILLIVKARSNSEPESNKQFCKNYYCYHLILITN